MKLIILLLTLILALKLYQIYVLYMSNLPTESYFCRDGSCYMGMDINFESDDESHAYPPKPKERETIDDKESIPFPNWEPCQCSGLYTQISYS